MSSVVSPEAAVSPAARFREERSRRVFVILRWGGIASAVVCTAAAPFVLAQSSWEVVLTLIVFGGGSTLVLYRFRDTPNAPLVACSVGMCVVLFVLFAENLLTFERVFKFRLSNRLQLSQQLFRQLADTADFRTDTFEQFGSDPLFFRRAPGSQHRARYDGKPGYEFVVQADAAGFLNGDLDFYDRHSHIDVLIAGDSVLQGVGTPGVTDLVKAKVPFSILSLSTGSYSARQKVQALREFGLSKRPKWLVVEFYAGNDSSEIIEDSVCDALQRDYLCRFDLELLERGLKVDSRYRHFGDFDSPAGWIQHIREWRSNSLSLALAASLAARVRRMLASDSHWAQSLTFHGEAITLPGFSHFNIHPDRYSEWIEAGLALSTKAYDELLELARKNDVRPLIIYNPTSYEIYREILPRELILAGPDAVSRLQRETLQSYATRVRSSFCDLTAGFRERVKHGQRGLFGARDGTHWSELGTQIAADVLVDCLESVITIGNR
jgi:hypothetical protein